MQKNNKLGFLAFISTQALGALNDNFFHMLLNLYVVSLAQLENAKELQFQATLALTVPFLIFGPWAGYVSDRFAKSSVLQQVKLFEILIMGLGVYSFYLESTTLMIGTLFLMTTQSTFFGPAKAGYIPETVPDRDISQANGWLEMTTFVAIILGSAVPGLLLMFHHKNAAWVSVYCLLIAGLGILASRFVRMTRAQAQKIKFPKNPLKEIFSNLAYLKKQKGLFLAALALSYFWLLGLVFKLNIINYGQELLQLNELHISLLAAYLALGIAAGSMLAARLSGHKVELGLVPLGGLGMAFWGALLFWTWNSHLWTSISLAMIGIFGGFFIVPLYAYLQFESAAEEKGRILSTVGIITGLFLVIATFLYNLLAIQLELNPNTIALIMSLMTLLVVIYICSVIPEYFIRFLAWLLAHSLYRIHLKGQEHVPLKGPALIICNHISFVDPLFVNGTIQRFVKFITYKKYFEIPLVHSIFKTMEAIPVAPYEGRHSIEESLQQARKLLKRGEVVCIFPEGTVTKTGELNKFKKGFETVIEGLDIPIIPMTLKNLWGRVFTWSNGKILFKWPKKILAPVYVNYGPALPANTTAEEAQAVIEKMLE